MAQIRAHRIHRDKIPSKKMIAYGTKLASAEDDR